MAVANELREQGFNVAEAVNANEAFSILHSGIPIDLVLADVGMSGPQEEPSLVGAIRGEYPDVKVVAAAQTDEHSLDDAVDGMLRKPYDVSKAASLVRTLLDP
jgi:DNA-binding NtrC family response regulator